MHTRAFATVLLAAALTVTGCGANGDSAALAGTSVDAHSGKGATQRSKTAESKVPEAFQFTGLTIERKRFNGEELAGKPTLLWFWAPWCGTCQREAPETRTLADHYGDKVNVIGVSGRDKSAAMRKFVTEGNVETLTHVVDATGRLWQRYGVTRQSSYILLDPKGKTVYNGVPYEAMDLTEHIDPLVEQTETSQTQTPQTQTPESETSAEPETRGEPESVSPSDWQQPEWAME